MKLFGAVGRTRQQPDWPKAESTIDTAPIASVARSNSLFIRWAAGRVANCPDAPRLAMGAKRASESTRRFCRNSGERSLPAGEKVAHHNYPRESNTEEHP